MKSWLIIALQRRERLVTLLRDRREVARSEVVDPSGRVNQRL